MKDKVNLTSDIKDVSKMQDRMFDFVFNKPESRVLYKDYQSLRVECTFERNSNGRKKAGFAYKLQV